MASDDRSRLEIIKQRLVQKLLETDVAPLNPCVTEEQLQAFERDYLGGRRLPEGYRLFLSEVGNGGAGPGAAPTQAGWDVIGMEMLPLNPEEGLDMAWFRPNDPFPLTEGQFAEDADDGPPGVLQNGSLNLCSWGCGGVTELIVTGPERGHVWYMDETEGSAWPEAHPDGKRLDFLDWYSLWLDGWNEWEVMNEILEA